MPRWWPTASTPPSARRPTALRFGVSVLPGEVGAWLRLVGDDTVATSEMTRAAWAARGAADRTPGAADPQVTPSDDQSARRQAARANGRPIGAATASIVPNVRS